MVCIYIYRLIERESYIYIGLYIYIERERVIYIYIVIYIYSCIYIYRVIYIYMHYFFQSILMNIFILNIQLTQHTTPIAKFRVSFDAHFCVDR